MPVPFETLIPYGIIIAMFGVTGAGVANVKYFANDKKRARRSVDQWDRQSMVSDIISSERTPLNSRIPRQELADKQFAVMDRDRRLTGRLRGQTNSPIANAGFELNNPWRVEPRIC